MHCWHGRNNRKGHSIRVHCRRAHGIKQGAESNDPRKSIVAHSWAAHSDHSDISGRPLQRCPHATQRRLRAMLLSHSVHSIRCMQSWLEYMRHMASSLILLAKKCLAWRGLERQQLLYCAPKACMLQRGHGSCMQVLTKPAPRLWPEQYTLVGGVPPLMPLTTLLQSDGCPSQPKRSVLSMISTQTRMCSACPGRPHPNYRIHFK